MRESGPHAATLAGRPLAPQQPRSRRLNLGCGRDIRPAEQGWVNVDGFFDHPEVDRWDFCRVPWPLDDDSFDLVYCGHVLEHVPLLYRERDGVQRDLLFEVMEEIHRILKPGGVLHLKVPWGGNGLWGLGHPQHYRQWRPDWFKFFSEDYGENYYSTARFRVLDWRRNDLGPVAPHWWPLGRERLGFTQHLWVRLPFLRRLLGDGAEIEARLQAVKR